jgi:pimeloyl-ACP methyl ester carboxylesterase
MHYRFGDCELRPDSHELVVGGNTRTVEPQVFDILLHLVRNAGKLVTQDDLINAVWNGRIVSDSAISARISTARAAVGDNGREQSVIKTVPRRGFRFVAPVETTEEPAPHSAAPRADENQRIRFCRAPDGTRIAFASTGSGYPLLRAGHWLTHLEHDWNSPVWRPFLDRMGQDFAVTRYDQRGNGLSDWDIDEFSLDRFVDDLEAVADSAGLGRFALYGTSQGAPIAVAYAVRHPERVSHLILHGGYVKGRMLRVSREEREQGEALLTLIRHGWGKPGSPFIQAFSSIYIPAGTREQIASLTELQRLTTSPDNAARIRAAVDEFDVGDLIDRIAVPTLVIHARDDGVQPLDQGRELAAGINNAEFVMLDSPNHTILEQESAFEVLFRSIAHFVKEDEAL